MDRRLKNDYATLLASARIEAAARLAEPHFGALANALRLLDLSDVGHLYFYEEEDGTLSAEWSFKDCHMGLVFDADPAQSGWWFASRIKTGAGQECGTMDDIDVPALVERTITTARRAR